MILLTLAAYLHDFDPFIVRFPQMLQQLLPIEGIKWYGTSYLAAFVIGWLLIKRIVAMGPSPLRRDQVTDLAVVLAIGIVVGGRLGYVIFYSPQLLISFTSDPPWWQALAINRGGMSAHGGILGVLVASGYFAWRQKLPWGHLMDLVAFAAPVGLMLGRVANFVNGELYGRVMSPDSPAQIWAVKFPQAMERWSDQRLNEAAPALREALFGSSGYTLSGGPAGLIPYCVHAVQQGNAQVIAVLEPMLDARHPSQIYQALGEGLALAIILLILWRKPRKPWVVGAWFGMGYGLLRIPMELFREPDQHIAHLEAAQLGITRGQWLSAMIFAISLVIWLIARRRNVQPLGTWLGRDDRESTGSNTDPHAGSPDKSSGKSPDKMSGKSFGKSSGKSSDKMSDRSSGKTPD